MLAQTHLPHATVQLRTLHTVYAVYAGGSVGLQRRTALRALTTRKIKQRAHCALAVVYPGREQDFR
jgi:hypothetical protein